MNDLAQAALWSAVFAAGVVACVAARAAGLATTYVRDCLHVGAGLWILGWPHWRRPVAPSLIVLGVAAATLGAPALAGRVRAIARFRDAVSGGDERWSGLVLYTASYAALTWVGLRGQAFPAAAALLALSLGDGLGGAVGRRWGRHRYTVPGGKPKSLEGSAVVALAAAGGAWIAAALFGAPVRATTVVGAGLVAAAAEAAAPRAMDNLAVPAAVWLFLGALR